MSATHVFANGHEIASKAVGKSGRSSSAMPDPCWSPPAPGAGPVVIPYPNTCFADSITKGTTTVMIAGKTVAIADQSRFDTSIGNEGATQAFNKGVATGVIKGKAYFTKWSSDVVFEGYGVPRDMDLVTHNHGSQPSNTPTFPFISSRDMAGDCKEDVERVNAACKPETEHSEFERTLNQRSSLRDILRRKHKATVSGKKWNWTHDHCDGLDMTLGSHEGAQAFLKEAVGSLQKSAEDLTALLAMEGQLLTALSGGGGDQKAAANALQRKELLEKELREIRQLRDKVGLDGKPTSLASAEEGSQSLGAQAQKHLALLNDCVRARKCLLTPYSSSAEHWGRDNSQKGRRGCCNGQTGHHLIYGAMMKTACPGYENEDGNQKHKDAPTVCVEGVNQSVGSHGRVHDAMDIRVAAIAKRRLKQARRLRIPFDGTISLDEMINQAAYSHTDAFPDSSCSTECVRKQLESFYKNACPDARPRLLDKHGGDFRSSRRGKRKEGVSFP